MTSPIQSTPSPPTGLTSTTNLSPSLAKSELPPAVPQTALRKLVASELSLAGFDSAEGEALDELEGIVWAFFGALLTKSHELSELSRRRDPNAKDVVKGIALLGIGGVEELKEEIHRDAGLATPITIKYDPPPSDPDDGPLLSSDSEDDTPTFQTTFTAPYLPSLPAKHSYRLTPVFPDRPHATLLPTPAMSVNQQTPSAAALAHLSTLRSRLNDSQLVASSLRNLIRRTAGRRVEEIQDGNSGEVATLTGAGEEDEDVVDYESVWYEGAGNFQGMGKGTQGRKKRRKGVIRVGGEGEGESKLVVEEGETESRKGEKRRKWRV